MTRCSATSGASVTAWPGFERPVEELIADATELAVNLIGLCQAAGIEHGKREGGAMQIGQAFEGAVSADDAVVIAGSEERPALRLGKKSAGLGKLGVGEQQEPAIHIAAQLIDGVGHRTCIKGDGFLRLGVGGLAGSFKSHQAKLGHVQFNQADALVVGGKKACVAFDVVELLAVEVRGNDGANGRNERFRFRGVRLIDGGQFFGRQLVDRGDEA